MHSGVWNSTIVPDGEQVGFIEGNGAISQSINFAEAGTYTLSFQAAYRDYFTGNNPSNPIQIQVDGINVGTVSRSPPIPRLQRQLLTSAGTHTIVSSDSIPEEETELPSSTGWRSTKPIPWSRRRSA